MPNFMFWALAAANANPGPRTPTSPDAMATAPVVMAGTYVDAIQPVVVSGMPLAGATPEQQQMPVVVVAGTYVRAQSRELARGIGSVQRGIARQLSGASSTRRLSGGTSSTPLPAPTERTEAASDAPGGGGAMGFGLHHRSSGTWVVRWLDGRSCPVTLTLTLTLP